MELQKDLITNKEKDYFDEFRLVMKKLQKKYTFIYNGVKFISDREIIGVEPDTYKLIYKNNN